MERLSPAAGHAPESIAYERHRPEETVLYGVVLWALTLPFALRYRLAYDAGLTSAVLREFVRAVCASHHRRARPDGSVRRARGGAVTFIQRFGEALNLNVHFHTLVLDGIYLRYGDPGMRFRALPPPEDAEVRRVVERVARRVARLLDRRGLGADADPLASAQPHLAVPARDRRSLERPCRYAARPPLATDRLERLADGRLLYRLRHHWRDGTTQIVFEPHQILGRLVPLIPAPGAHQVRYHGVLAPWAGWRDLVIPAGSRPNKTSRLARCRGAPGEETGPLSNARDRTHAPERDAAEPSPAATGGRVPLRLGGSAAPRVRGGRTGVS